MVLICLLAFFGLIAAMNAVLIRLAISTFGGVETENAYQAGLNFSRDIAAAETQNALQWQVKATVSTGPDATVVELVSRDADGRVLAGLDANARLVHPTDRRCRSHRAARRTRGRDVSRTGRGCARQLDPGDRPDARRHPRVPVAQPRLPAVRNLP